MEKKVYQTPKTETVHLEADAHVMLLSSGTGLEPLYP